MHAESCAGGVRTVQHRGSRKTYLFERGDTRFETHTNFKSKRSARHPPLRLVVTRVVGEREHAQSISQNTLSIQNGWVGADKKQPHSLFMETTKDVLQPHGARPVLRMQGTKPRLAAAMSRHQVSRKVLAMDLTGSASFPLPERTSYLGALLTVVAVGLWLTYIVALTLAWAKNPPRSTSDIRWSSNHGPSEGSAGPPSFPIELVCSAAEGCGIALHYSGQTPLSAKCAASVANQGCVTAAYGERLRTALCYSDQPEDGIYAFHTASANASLGLLGVSEDPLMECAAMLEPQCSNACGPPVSLLLMDPLSLFPLCALLTEAALYTRQNGFPPPPRPHPTPLCGHH